MSNYKSKNNIFELVVRIGDHFIAERWKNPYNTSAYTLRVVICKTILETKPLEKYAYLMGYPKVLIIFAMLQVFVFLRE